jgi:4-amino-4-deoxy-L-arabinose transferase-like glycosyltransferase
MTNAPRTLRTLLLLVLLSAGLRLTLFALVRPWAPATESRYVLQSDPRDYHNLATTLLHHHRFANGAADEPTALRTPGYPAFVAAIYSLFGPRPWVVLVAQIALDVLSCLLLFAILVPRFGRAPAVAAAVLYAMDPFLTLYSSTTLYSDTLFVFLLLASLWFLGGAFDQPDPRKRMGFVALSGLMLGLHVLTRPISQFLGIVFVITLIAANRRKPRLAFEHAGVFALAFLAILLPWMLRNQQVLGRFTLSSSDSYNLLVLNAVPLEMRHRNQDMHTVKQALLGEADDLMRADGLDPERLNELEKAGYQRRLALSYIRHDPSGFMKCYVVGIAHMFGNLGTSIFADALGLPSRTLEMKAYPDIRRLALDFVRVKGPAMITLAAFLMAFLLITYVSALVGLFVTVRQSAHWPFVIFLLALLGYFVLITGVAGLARFKMPAIPLYLALSGVGIVRLREITARRACLPPA